MSNSLALPEKRKRWTDVFVDYGIYTSVVILFFAFGFFFPQAFFSVTNVRNILASASVIGIMAIGMTFVILTANIDLSVGSAAYFAVALGVLAVKRAGWHPFLGILIIVATAIGIGALNGFQISRLKMVPLIATLASLGIFRGLALQFTDAASIYGMPPLISKIGIGYVGSAPIPIIMLFVLYVLAYYILEKTRFGTYVYAVGGDRDAAFKAGIHVPNVMLSVYLLHGFFVGMASLILCARMDGVVPALGAGMEFDVITAVILGGTSFSGGVGNIWGTLAGAVIITLINTALTILNVSAFYYDIFKGSVILLAVVLDTFRQRRMGIIT
uniref:ABC transporter permease n=1 Tax=Candidatus Caldatribacterium californiense TaxID=1454726 RepID=A0A7V3YEY6_9BACT